MSFIYRKTIRFREHFDKSILQISSIVCVLQSAFRNISIIVVLKDFVDLHYACIALLINQLSYGGDGG